MTLDVPIAITLIFIWALLSALGFDRNFKILSFNHNYERPEHDSKWKAFDSVCSKPIGNLEATDTVDDEIDAIIKQPEPAEPEPAMQTTAAKVGSDIKKPIHKDAQKTNSFFANMKHWLSNKTISNPPKDQSLSLRSEKRGNPVIYNVEYAEVIYRKPNRFTFRQRPTEKFMKKFTYKSKYDALQNDWQRHLRLFSERNPVLYNNCLWTTTKTAQSRNKFPGNEKNRKVLLHRKTKKIIITKNFLYKPHEKCIYKIKKDIRVELTLTTEKK